MYLYHFIFVSVAFVVDSMYNKCRIISYTKVFDEMAYAYSVDPDKTAPSGHVLHFCHSTKFFKKQLP